MIMEIATAASEAATAITNILKNIPSILCGYRYLLKARKLIFTEFKISSTDINIVIRLRRVRKPYTPAKNIMVASTRKY
jgi:hypothetical protein